MNDKTRRADMPMQTRLAPIGTVNKATRTADLVWTTGARVMRYDWMRDRTYLEELSLGPANVRMGRLQSGAPLLNAHNRWSLEDQIGVVDGAALSGGEGTATVRFSSRADVEPIFQDVQDKIIRNVSAGYITHRVEILPPDDASNGLPIYRAVDWEPMEISLVPIGADAGAGVRTEQQRTYPCEFIDAVSFQNPAVPAISREESTMDQQQRAAPAAAMVAASTTEEEARTRAAAAETTRAATEAATAAERTRVKGIRDLCAAHKLDRAFEDTLINENIALDSARQRVLDELAKKTTATPVRSGDGGTIFVTGDETVIRREAMSVALLARHDPRTYNLNAKENEAARQYAGMTLREMMRFCLEQKGIRTMGMSPVLMWQRTYESGSDLPAIVLDAANKSLRRAYDSSPRTFVAWARESTAPDFKNINRIQMSGAPSLLEVKSGGEIKRGVVTDGKEVYNLASYARIIGINRQTIINDDMGAFTRIPELCARAAADLESDTVYGIVTTNAALGVDNTALFDSATHKNYTASGTALSVASLGVGRAAMRVQTGLEGRVLNLRPTYLIVPAAKESLAEQFTSNAYQANVQSSINPFAQGGRAALTPITEARLDANSATAWYLAADPAQVDTIEYAYLEGQQGVYLESRMGFEVDGLEIKVREDFAAKALDFRGLYKNAGA
jgi:hypothetical protein